jgi:hypothetical protein
VGAKVISYNMDMIIYEEILREFQEEGVKYAIAGGIAFNLLGGLRSTSDLDILVEMSDDNLRKIVTILKKRGYKVKQPVDPMGIADESTRRDWIENKNMKAFNFYKDDDLKEVDILIDTPVSYEKAKEKMRKIKAGNITLSVVSVDDLIKMKEATGRNIDKLDVTELKNIKKLEDQK